MDKKTIHHGDRITAQGLTFTVDQVLTLDFYGDRKERRPGSDWFGFDCEFTDTRGNYHHWKQSIDGGQVARWTGRNWQVFNLEGYTV